MPVLERSHLQRMPGAIVHSWSQTSSKARQIEARLAELGIPLPPSSRLAEYRRSLEDLIAVGNGQRQSHPRFSIELLRHASQEVNQVHTIVRVLGNDPARWRDELANLIDGSSLTREDANSTGRDRQAELYVAARLALAGYEVRPGEPDLVLDLDGWRLGVAVKRIRSVQQLRKRSSKGRAQIKQSGLAGLLVLDVSALLVPDVIRTTDLATVPDTLNRSLASFIITTFRPEGLVDSRAPSVGAIVLAHFQIERTDGPQLGSGTATRVASFLERGDRRRSILQRLSNRLASSDGSPGHRRDMREVA